MPVDGDIILKAGLDISGIKKNMAGLQKTISKGLKNALRIGLGVRSIFALIRRLRSALFEGFENLAQVHEPFNEAMSEIMTSLNLLKNTFAASFAPIVETVAPILSQFINMIAEAVAQVGMFIAALTGKEYVRAASVWQDYASSVDKSTASSKSATSATKQQTKAQKELNREITHFDDLVILHDKREEDTTPTITPTTTPSYSFSNVPIGSAVAQFAKDFQAAWANADFTKLGEKLGQKLKEALENIPWNGIKTVLAKIAKSIATFLNGFLEVPGLFSTIGLTLAQVINSAFTFVESFVKNFHWASLGIAVRDLIVGALGNIDWALIYRTARGIGQGVGTALNNAFNNPEVWTTIFNTIGNRIRTLFVTLYSFINTVDWAELGRNIATGLNNGVANFPWRLIGLTLVGIINNAFNFLTNFLATFDFASLVKTLQNVIVNAINNINPEAAIFLLSWVVFGKKLLGKLLIALILVSDYIKWDEVGTAIGTAISAALNRINWLNAGYKIGSVLSNLFTALNSLVKVIDWGAVGQAVVDLIAGFLKTFDWTTLKETIKGLIKGLADALWATVDSPEDVQTWNDLGNKIITVLVDALSAASEALLENGGQLVASLLIIGGAIIAGIFQGIGDAIKGLPQWLKKNVLDPFVDWIKLLFGIHSPSTVMKPIGNYIGQGLLDGIGRMFNTIGQWIKTHIVDPFLKWIKEKFGITGGTPVLFGIGSSVINSFLDGIDDVAKGFADWIDKHVVQPFLTGFQSIKDGLTTLFSDTGESDYSLNQATEGVDDFATAIEYLNTVVNNDGDLRAYGELQEALQQLHSQGLIPDTEAFNQLNTSISENGQAINGTTDTVVPFSDITAGLSTALYNAGVNADDLNVALGLTPSAATSASEGLDTITSSASDADTNTQGVADALGLFEGLKWSTPLKMAIISAAIDSLADSGKISDEQATSLHDTLDKYDPKKPKESMKTVATAFENAGVSGKDMATAISNAMVNSKADVAREATGIVGKIDTMGTKLKTSGTRSGKNIDEGLVSGIQGNAPSVYSSCEKVLVGAFAAMDNTADMHSPSGVTKTKGQYLMQGLIQGIDNYTSQVIRTASSVVESIVSTFQGAVRDLESVGSDIVRNISRGINNNSDTVIRTAEELGTDIMSNIVSGISANVRRIDRAAESVSNRMYRAFDDVDWLDLGQNIASGIGNGLLWSSDWLQRQAWNVAVSMYNSACWALGIASPSKKFAWIGEMMMQGLGNGVTDNQGLAIDAVSDLTNAMTDEAEKTNPAVSISTSIDDWIDTLDTVLTDFSDTIINRFDGMINTLIQLSDASAMLPAVVQGRVIPSSMSTSASASDNMATVMRALENLQSLASDHLSVDDLRPLLIEIVSEYLSWSIGDEQLARHVNNGNLKLDRRYSTIKV